MSEPNVYEQLAGMTIERDAALAELKHMTTERDVLTGLLGAVLEKIGDTP